MSTKQIIAVAVMMASVVLNALFINERLEKSFYQKGVNDGSRQLSDRLVAEVQKSQAINVKMPDGKQVVLATLEAFQKQLAARQIQPQTQQSPIPPGRRVVIPSKAAQEPPIDAIQGTIDDPVEVNKP